MRCSLFCPEPPRHPISLVGEDVVPLLANYSSQAHDLDMSFKFYYTIRELSNHAAELFPILSLRGEIVLDVDPHFVPQPGYCHDADCWGGAVYLHEHVLSNYSGCWQQGLSNGEIDAAVCDIVCVREGKRSETGGAGQLRRKEPLAKTSRASFTRRGRRPSAHHPG